MNFAIENIRIIEEEYLDNFVFKKEISEIEAYGLEMCLVKLLMDADYEVERAYDIINSFTRHLEDSIDILDGCEDILYIEQYEVLSVHLTENGIPVLKCLKEDCDYYEDEASIYYATIG
ncbi:MAG: hypothetical protein ACRCX8_04725 [Sarcina sp.]